MPNDRQNYTPTVGEWVTTHLPGLWQVYHVLAGFNELRYSLDEPKRRSRRVLVFAKQLPPGNPASGTAPPAIRATSCEQSLVWPLSDADRDRVTRRLDANPARRSAFDACVPEVPGLIVNLTLRLPDRQPLEQLCEATLQPALTGGIPLDQVLAIVDTAGLADHVGRMPTNTTLQLGNVGHELQDGDFILRTCKVLPF